MTCLVSVVVPTYKRPKLLQRCLSALLSQDFDPTSYEIIVVDDAGDPDTRQVVEDVSGTEEGLQISSGEHYLKNVLDLRNGISATSTEDIHGSYHLSTVQHARVRYFAMTDKHGPSAARNIGWRAAEGELIAFTDDDCIPWPTWLQAGVNAYQDGVSGISGQVIVPISANPTDYELDTLGLERSDFVTANCFYQKKVLEEVGGFDERFKAAWREDSDLHFILLEKGYKLINGPTAIVIHPVRHVKWGISLSQQKKSQYNALLYKKHPDLYRKKVQSRPPWRYYWIVLFFAIGLAGILIQNFWIAFAGIATWFVLTVEFCQKRLENTAHTLSHIAEMAFTSILIPPLAIFWRIYGAVKFLTLFL